MQSQEFKKILQLALFVIDDDKTETKSKADIHLHVDQVTKVLKGIKVTTRMQESKHWRNFLKMKKFNGMKACSIQVTERMRRL